MLYWNGYLKLILSKYKDKPDNFVISIGHWEMSPTTFKNIELPEFRAYLKMTMGELRGIQNEQ